MGYSKVNERFIWLFDAIMHLIGEFAKWLVTHISIGNLTVVRIPFDVLHS